VLCYFVKDAAHEAFIPLTSPKSSSSTFLDPQLLQNRRSSYDISKFTQTTSTASDTIKVPHNGDLLKGVIVLHGASVTIPTNDSSGRFRISTSYHGAKDFLLETETREDALAWTKDIQLHIRFAQRYPYLVDLASIPGKV
jgi:hypothetical protein